MATGIRTPSGLPLAERTGYGDTYEETRTAVEMQIGPARIRNRMRSAPRIFDVQWTLDQLEYQIFDIWFQETIAGGLNPFDIQLLDVSDQLRWWTCEWQSGSYSAEVSAGGIWTVTGRLRSKLPPFDDRSTGTDDLHGYAQLSLRATARMQIAVALHGRAVLGIGRAESRPRIQSLYGFAKHRLIARAKLNAVPFHGKTILGIGMAKAAPAQFGAASLILQFDASVYTPPDGGSVDLQFDSTVYYPPHIV